MRENENPRFIDGKTLINLWYLKENKLEIFDKLLNGTYSIAGLRDYQLFIKYLLIYNEVNGYHEMFKITKLQLRLVEALQEKTYKDNYFYFGIELLDRLVNKTEEIFWVNRPILFFNLFATMDRSFKEENQSKYAQILETISKIFREHQHNFSLEALEEKFFKQYKKTICELLVELAKKLNEVNFEIVKQKINGLKNTKLDIKILKKENEKIQKNFENFSDIYSTEQMLKLKILIDDLFKKKRIINHLTTIFLPDEKWKQILRNEDYQNSILRRQIVQILLFNNRPSNEHSLNNQLAQLKLEELILLFFLLLEIPLKVTALTYSPLRKTFIGYANNQLEQTLQFGQEIQSKENVFCYHLKHHFNEFLIEAFQLLSSCFYQQLEYVKSSDFKNETLGTFQKELNFFKRRIEEFSVSDNDAKKTKNTFSEIWQDLNKAFETSKMDLEKPFQTLG